MDLPGSHTGNSATEHDVAASLAEAMNGVESHEEDGGSDYEDVEDGAAENGEAEEEQEEDTDDDDEDVMEADDAATTTPPPTVKQPTAEEMAAREAAILAEREAAKKAAAEQKEKGNEFFKQKKYRESLPFYSAAIQLDSECAAFYGNRAAAQIMLQDFAAALPDCEQCVKMEPENVKFCIRLGKCYLGLGRWTDAHRVFRSALDLDPNNEEAKREFASLDTLENLRKNAESAIAAGKFSSACSFIDRALDIAPSSVNLKLMKCQAYLGMKNDADADRVVSGVLREQGTNADALYWRGMVMIMKGDIEQANTHFQRALRFSPDHTLSQAKYKFTKKMVNAKEEGNALFKEGKLEEAYARYSEALAMDPDCKLFNSKLYFNRAVVLGKMKRLKEAIDDCTKAFDIDPSYIKALRKRAELHLEAEMFEDCVRDYEKAKEMEPNNNEIRQLLQNAKIALKKSQRKDYYKILEISQNADEQEIQKAYKRQALKWHPDRHQGEEAKKIAEAKFKDVSEANTILSDPRKRRIYDSGEDLEEGHSHGGGGGMDPRDFMSMFGGGFGGFGGFGGGGGGFGGPRGFGGMRGGPRSHGGGFPPGGFGGFGGFHGHGHGHDDDDDDDDDDEYGY